MTIDYINQDIPSEPMQHIRAMRDEVWAAQAELSPSMQPISWSDLREMVQPALDQAKALYHKATAYIIHH